MLHRVSEVSNEANKMSPTRDSDPIHPIQILLNNQPESIENGIVKKYFYSFEWSFQTHVHAL